MKFVVTYEAVIEVSGSEFMEAGGDLDEAMSSEKNLKSFILKKIKMPDGEVVKVNEDCTKEFRRLIKGAKA